MVNPADLEELLAFVAVEEGGSRSKGFLSLSMLVVAMWSSRLAMHLMYVLSLEGGALRPALFAAACKDGNVGGVVSCWAAVEVLGS